MIIMEKQGMTRLELIKFYKNQLNKFHTVGYGNKTENGVIITKMLIDTTKRRLAQLQFSKTILGR